MYAKRMSHTEDEESGDQSIETFAGVVSFDENGEISEREQSRLLDAVATNIRIADLHEGYRKEYTDAEAKIGANIRDERQRQGLSQEHLATLLRTFGFEMHQTTVAKIEGGKRPLRVAEMFAFADALSLPWLSLIEGGRDIDILPSEGMLPIDIWEAGLENLLHKRQDTLEEVRELVEDKARQYAEWDRMILMRISALANAAATARRRGEELDEERLEKAFARWNEEARASSMSRARWESPEELERRDAFKKKMDSQREAERAVVREFLAWRSSRKPEPDASS